MTPYVVASLGVCLSSLMGPEPTSPPADEAIDRALHEDATARLQASQYQEAAVLFSALHARTGDPWSLYNAAQARRLAGECALAVELYQRFLTTDDLEASDKEDALRNIERCAATEPVVATASNPMRPPPPSAPSSRSVIVVPSHPLPNPSVDRPLATTPTQPWRQPDVWATSAAGVGALAVGLPLWIVGQRALRQDPAAFSEGAYVTEIRRGRTRRGVGAAFVVAGGALLSTAVVLVALSVRGKRGGSAPRGTGRFAARSKRGFESW